MTVGSQGLGFPRAPAPDSTLALLREGYGFVSRQCDALGSDVFETRIMLRKVVCMRGPEAARLLYGPAPLTRVGSMPTTALRLLQDKGSVQQLDGAAHLHRKSLFVAQLMDRKRVDRLVDVFREGWMARLPQWRAQGRVDLFAEANVLLTGAALEWVEIPQNWFAADDLARRLASMVEHAGHFGPGTIATLLSRNTVERRLRDLVLAVREDRVSAARGTILWAMCNQTHLDGRPVEPRTCAVELINLLRPVAAVSRYVVYAALALERNPGWRERFSRGEDEHVEPFVEEIRRYYPFFPVIGAVARAPFEWAGRQWDKGQWFLLDLYGTTHHPRLFPSPEAFSLERSLSWTDQGYAFIPQGAGVTATTHRCPGEMITVRLVSEAVRILSRQMRYRYAGADLPIRLNRMPALPENTSMEIL